MRALEFTSMEVAIRYLPGLWLPTSSFLFLSRSPALKYFLSEQQGLFALHQKNPTNSSTMTNQISTSGLSSLIRNIHTS